MSRQEAATQLFISAPPASIDVVIEQLERDAQAAGIDIHTISVMASLLRDRIEAYSDVLEIEPERVIHALEVLRGTEVPWAFTLLPGYLSLKTFIAGKPLTILTWI